MTQLLKYISKTNDTVGYDSVKFKKFRLIHLSWRNLTVYWRIEELRNVASLKVKLSS